MSGNSRSSVTERFYLQHLFTEVCVHAPVSLLSKLYRLAQGDQSRTLFWWLTSTHTA